MGTPPRKENTRASADQAQQRTYSWHSVQTASQALEPESKEGRNKYGQKANNTYQVVFDEKDHRKSQL
jgi:hypothetical protein